VFTKRLPRSFWLLSTLGAAVLAACGGGSNTSTFISGDDTPPETGDVPLPSSTGVFEEGRPDADTDPLDVDALLGAACAAAQAEANRTPLYMLFVLDGSGSMRWNGKWAATVPALRAIFDDFAKNEDPSLGAGLTVFADRRDITIGDYTAGPYDKMDVPLGFVDATQRARFDARLTTEPYLGTPTFEVLDGQYKLMRAFTPTAPLLPGGRKVVVFITDGIPDPDMPAGPEGGRMALELAKQMTELPSPEGPIRTFVVGVGPFPVPADAVHSYSPEFCGALAVAGGTRASETCNPSEPLDPTNTCHFQVTPPESREPTAAEIDTLRQSFVDAITTVRLNALSCEYPLERRANGDALDPTKVNVVYRSGEGGKSIVPNSAADGWTYDDPANPTKVVLNGPTCEKVKADARGKITVVLGCKTVIR
jgi:hypothetical protein